MAVMTMSLPVNFNDLDPDERAARLASARKLAAVDASYQQTVCEYSTRQLRDWLAVETREERQTRRAAERLERHDAAREAERIHALEAAREERQHELMIAKTYAEANGNGAGNGVDVSSDIVDALSMLGDAINSLAARVEALEAGQSRTDAVTEATTRRLDYVAPNAREAAEKATAQLKGAIDEVKADVGFLKFRLDVLNSKRNEPLEQRVIVIPG
jgi:hypothetical protein